MFIFPSLLATKATQILFDEAKRLSSTMHPKVRDLYKRFMIAGRLYPKGPEALRIKVKEGFRKNQHLTDEVDIKRAVATGRWWVREVQAITSFTKYRFMKNKYDGDKNSEQQM